MKTGAIFVEYELKFFWVKRMKSDDRRQFHRIDYGGRVYLEFTDDCYDCCQIKNLCMGGMFIAGIFSQKQNENCHIYIYHNPESGSPCLHGSALVVMNNGEGIGLKFTSMTHKNYMLLLAILINNTKQPITSLNESTDHYPFEIIDI